MKKQIVNTLSVALMLLGTPSYSAHNISGQVLDKNGKPIKNASIIVHGSNLTLLTDEQGKFSIVEDMNHIDELHIQAKGFSHASLLLNEEQTHYQITLNQTAIERIDVYATPLHGSTLESATPISVLSDEDLKNKHAPTLGETLKSEVGVHSSYYGPVSSSPIIRGLDGARVMITQNGLDAGDASRVGSDHVVATETSTVKQIEVLRGPATLFYGSGAIGGVINVVDNRVPREVENSGEWQLSHNNGSDQKEASFSLNGGEDNIAYHIDGFWRDSGDHKIPSEPELHLDETEQEHEAHEEEFHGVLENSASKSSGFNLGTSYIFDDGFIGISYGRLDRLYGIPGHAHHEEEEHEGELEEAHQEHEEEHGVQGDLTQNRIQVLSEWSVDALWFTAINTQFGFTDYQHKEIEGDEIGTVFNNDTLEFKGDLLLAPLYDWHGALTFDYKYSDFEAQGEEAFTPPSEYTSYAIGLLEEKHFDNVLVQLGVRVEQVTIDTDGTSTSNELVHEPYQLTSQQFNPVSASAGLVWDYQAGYNLGLSYSFSQRAPSASELFSFGPHIGTNTYEVGALFHQHDDEFELAEHTAELETSNNIELSWRKFNGNFGFVLNAFYNSIDDFYYQADTGLNLADGHDEHEETVEEHAEHEEEGLPIFLYQANDAYFYGFEGQFSWVLTSDLKVSLQADHIRGQLQDGDNLPRIPPARIGLMLDYTWQNWSFDMELMHNTKQADISHTETKTASYTMLDAVLSNHFSVNNLDMSAYVKVTNGLNETARVHSSFLKNTTVLPSRALTLGIRGYF